MKSQGTRKGRTRAFIVVPLAFNSIEMCDAGDINRTVRWLLITFALKISAEAFP